MGWELMSTNTQLCPCGNGFVVEKRYMDDWNNTEEDCYIECEDCKEKQIIL